MNVNSNKVIFVLSVTVFLVLIFPQAFGKPNSSLEGGKDSKNNNKAWIDKSRKIKKIRKNGDKEDVQYLQKILRNRDENWKVRLSAFQALSQVGSTDAEEVRSLLIEEMQQECNLNRKNLKPPVRRSFGSEDWVIEARMKRALEKYFERTKGKNRTEILQSLSKRLENDEEGKFACYLAMILGEFGRSNALPVLIRCVKNSSYGLIRKESAKVLGELGNKKAIPALKDALDDPFVLKNKGDVKGKVYGHVVRRAAAESLKKLGVDVVKIERDKYKVKDK